MSNEIEFTEQWYYANVFGNAAFAQRIADDFVQNMRQHDEALSDEQVAEVLEVTREYLHSAEYMDLFGIKNDTM